MVWVRGLTNGLGVMSSITVVLYVGGTGADFYQNEIKKYNKQYKTKTF